MDATPSPDRRLTALLLVAAVIVAAAVLLLTPYNLRIGGFRVPEPYEPPPLSSLRPLREQINALVPHAPVIALAGAAALAGGLAWRLKRAGQPREASRAALLIAAFGAAVAGQAEALSARYEPAALLYAGALVGFGAWAYLSRARLPLAMKPARVPPRMEWVALALVMLLAVGARFFELGRIPYGIEGDEAKWTAEVAGVMIDQRHVLASEWHYAGVPGSFYMQAPFHHIFKPSLMAARLSVAVYSALATLVFYALVRLLFNVPVALLATLLMAVSLVDLSASRLALVEGFTKLWTVAAPLVLLLASHYRRVWLFALAGAVFGLGIVTYDTYLPMLGVGGAILLVETVSLWRRESPALRWRAWLARWAVFAAALGPFLARAMIYIGGRGGDYRFEELGWRDAPLETLVQGVARVLRVFAEQVDRDFMHTREGPLVNGLLVPLVALGAVGCLVLWRRRATRVPLLWAALTLFPAPVFLMVHYPRVLYVSLPALYMLAAVGAVWLFQALWSWLGRLGRRALATVIGVALVVYPTLNLYIYFNEVYEPPNDIATREAADLLLNFAAADRYILIPYLPQHGDVMEHSGSWLDFYLRQNFAEGTQWRLYRLLPYQDLLPAMARAFEAYESVAVLVDYNVSEREQREAYIQAVRECYHTRVGWRRTYTELILFERRDQSLLPCPAPDEPPAG